MISVVSRAREGGGGGYAMLQYNMQYAPSPRELPKNISRCAI